MASSEERFSVTQLAVRFTYGIFTNSSADFKRTLDAKVLI